MSDIQLTAFSLRYPYELYLAPTSPASLYWGFDQSITYGPTSKAILPLTAGIVDTGTTLLLISSNAFEAYTVATGAVLDDATGLLKLTPTQFARLEDLKLNIAGVRFKD